MEHRCQKAVCDDDGRWWPCGYCDWCKHTLEGTIPCVHRWADGKNDKERVCVICGHEELIPSWQL